MTQQYVQCTIRIWILLCCNAASLQIQKIASHIESVGAQAVMGGYAELVDIIGNAAELAAALICPERKEITKAKQIDQLATAICTRT